MPLPASSEIVVIGGGPGGSTVATLLARRGHQVLLLERAVFPREHVGESLLPASIPVLEELGVMPAIEAAGFLQKWGATMVWGRDSEPWSWFFSETNKRYPHAYQVWRPHFDQILLENSRASGVDVREGCRVLDVRFESERATGVRVRDDAGEEAQIAAGFVVDASGQEGLIGRRLRLREPDTFFKNLAVYGYFRGGERLPEPASHNIFIEAYPHGWTWNIPLHTGVMSVGVVVDSAYGQEGIAAAGLEAFFADQLQQAPHTQRMQAAAALESGPFIVRDWSYVSGRLVGDGYILVGDAACFIDPLFSSGVHLALSSGVMAAAYVTSALRDPEIATPAAAVYAELYLQQYHQFREMAKLFYASNRNADSYFWEARRITQAGDSTTPREAFIAAVAGQPPQGYERAVLERGDAPADFVQGVRTVEDERAARRERVGLAIDRAWPDRSPLLEMRPRLAAGVGLARKPVIGEGAFEWGAVVTSRARPAGAPISMLVAALIDRIDGRRTVRAVIDGLLDGAEAQRAGVLPGILNALSVLYVDGVIESLQELDRD